MATAAQYLTQLQTDGVRAKFFDDNFMNDAFLNASRYENDADISTGGRLSVTVERQPKAGSIDDPTAFNTELAEDNGYTEPERFDLAKYGKKYSVDTGFPEPAFSRTNDRLASDHANRAKTSFVNDIINGDGTGAHVVGFSKFCEDNNLVMDQFDASGSMTEALALSFLEYFNKMKGKMNVAPTHIVASREFAAVLYTMNSLMNRHTRTVNIGDLSYETFAGLPIIEVGNDVLAQYTALAGDTGLDEDDEYQFFYMVRMDEIDGVYLSAPESGLIKAVMATKAQAEVTGADIVKGFVQIVSCPVFGVTSCVYKAPVKVVDNA